MSVTIISEMTARLLADTHTGPTHCSSQRSGHYLGHSTANSLHSIWQPCQPVPSILCNNTKKFCYSQACCPLRISEIQSFFGNLTKTHLRPWAFHPSGPAKWSQIKATVFSSCHVLNKTLKQLSGEASIVHNQRCIIIGGILSSLASMCSLSA